MATREQWQRLQEVFEDLRTCTPAEREDRLRQIAKDDPQLAADVRGLLQDHDSLDPDFLTPPPPPDLDPEHLSQPGEPEPDPLLGQQVDAFCVVELIARGGMGSVYRVEQQNPKRTVALKLLHREYITRPVRSRFEYESAILARLQHPNIAQIHHAGTHGDQPYFAMEYVENAQWITAYARDKELSLNDRLVLFGDLCEAVQHGHQRGIIHRDLKPANVLVDGDGRLKVIDFGIARITDTDMTLVTRQTDAGQVLGTLQYMSPEQCAADPHGVDVRSDVYALGVILYELLCDQLPYDVRERTPHSAIRVVCETAPAHPSLVRPAIRGDLEHVILTALQKGTQVRYQSVGDLLRDVQHYLVGEPIEARKPTAWTQAIRWIGRNPIAATTIACVTIVATSLLLMLMAVQLLFVVPTEIEFANDNSEVHLLSRSGRLLKAWSEAGGVAQIAEIVDRPTPFGGEQLVLVGFRNRAQPEASNRLTGYEIGRYDDPVLEISLKDSDGLPDLHERGYTWMDFAPSRVVIADAFPGPEHPGGELIVSFRHHTHSQSVLRICNFAGVTTLRALAGRNAQQLHLAPRRPTPGRLLYFGTLMDRPQRRSTRSSKAHLRTAAEFRRGDDEVPAAYSRRTRPRSALDQVSLRTANGPG